MKYRSELIGGEFTMRQNASGEILMACWLEGACSVASVNSILESISEAKASVASRAELMDSRMRLRW
jgi:hypothetical protein